MVNVCVQIVYIILNILYLCKVNYIDDEVDEQ